MDLFKRLLSPERSLGVSELRFQTGTASCQWNFFFIFTIFIPILNIFLYFFLSLRFFFFKKKFFFCFLSFFFLVGSSKISFDTLAH